MKNVIYFEHKTITVLQDIIYHALFYTSIQREGKVYKCHIYIKNALMGNKVVYTSC